jgi:hypothetical protein
MSFEDEVLFKGITIQGKPLVECEVVYKDQYDNLRLYVYKDKGENSFWAKLVEFAGCVYCGEDSVWNQEDLTVDVLLDVVAYWDGIRHVTPSYMNYPDVLKLSEVYKVLAKIEDEVCQETSRSPRV